MVLACDEQYLLKHSRQGNAKCEVPDMTTGVACKTKSQLLWVQGTRSTQPGNAAGERQPLGGGLLARCVFIDRLMQTCPQPTEADFPLFYI